jgi:hypothetical protein
MWLRFGHSAQISVQRSVARAAPQLRNFSTLVATNKHHLPLLPSLPTPHLCTAFCSAAKLLHIPSLQDHDLFTQYSDSPVLIFHLSADLRTCQPRHNSLAACCSTSCILSPPLLDTQYILLISRDFHIFLSGSCALHCCACHDPVLQRDCFLDLNALDDRCNR